MVKTSNCTLSQNGITEEFFEKNVKSAIDSTEND